MKTKFAAVALIISATLCCSDSYGHDLLNRMLGRGVGSCCEAAPTCCDTPAPSCGRTICITLPGRGLLAGLGHRGGCCEAPATDCGCEAPVADPCCEASSGGGLLSGRFKGGRCGGCGLFKGGIGNGCGCDLMTSSPCAEVVEPSCCEETSGGGLLQNCKLFNGGLLGKLGSIGCGSKRGCSEEVADCGCEPAPAPCVAPAPAPAPCAAPVADCGCDSGCETGCGLHLRGHFSGLLTKVRSLGCGRCGTASADCGCEAAPAPAPCVAPAPCAAPAPACGCEEAALACGCGRSCGLLSKFRSLGCHHGGHGDCGCDPCDNTRVKLLDRLRGSRIARNHSCCDSGCDASVSSDCGCGAAAPVDQQHEGDSAIEAPVAPIAAPEADAAVPAGDGASRYRTPVVDPSAFIIRGASYRN